MKMLNTTGGMEINTFIERMIMEIEKLCTEIKTMLKDETEASLKDKQTNEVTALLEEIDVHQDEIEEIKVSVEGTEASQDETEASLKEMKDKQTKEVKALLEKIDVHQDGIEEIKVSGEEQALDSSEEEEKHAENLEELPQL